MTTDRYMIVLPSPSGDLYLALLAGRPDWATWPHDATTWATEAEAVAVRDEHFLSRAIVRQYMAQ